MVLAHYGSEIQGKITSDFVQHDICNVITFAIVDLLVQ
jgi:hypothetical protein